MQFFGRVVDAIGNTPLIKLRRASEATGCTILGKAEFLNPGGSVKDRAARPATRNGAPEDRAEREAIVLRQPAARSRDAPDAAAPRPRQAAAARRRNTGTYSAARNEGSSSHSDSAS